MRWYSWVLALLVVISVSSGAFVAGVSVERSGVLPGAVHQEPTDVQKQFNVFWEVWGLVQQHFVDQAAVDPQEMTYGAIDGMLSSLGDEGHTRFLTPEEASLQSSDITGRFFGIGAELGVKDGHPIIVAPLDGSPADKAGIRAGDILVEVDGQPVAEMSLDKIVRLVRGPKDTPVTLTVIHPGEMSVTQITIVRAEVQVNPISWAMVPGTKIAHLRISQFNGNTNQQLVPAIEEIKQAGATAMVVDMRNDPGGLLDQAVTVTDQFITEGDIVLEQDAEGKRSAIQAHAGGAATEIPIVVLINLGTASGAEIFAGAIQDHHRGELVGEDDLRDGHGPLNLLPIRRVRAAAGHQRVANTRRAADLEEGHTAGYRAAPAPRRSAPPAQGSAGHDGRGVCL